MKYPFTIALWLLTSAAAAYESELPPPFYDYPYPGPVKEIWFDDMKEFDKHCPLTPLAGYLTIACTRPPERGSNTCWIYYAPKEVLERRNVNIEFLRRHEMGHCNGWEHPPPDPRNPRKPILSDEERQQMLNRERGGIIFPK